MINKFDIMYVENERCIKTFAFPDTAGTNRYVNTRSIGLKMQILKTGTTCWLFD